ncbi:MAG: hypothetical protein LBJ92_01080 [Holosporales bacterium]|jgi:hypothetical protein|nr:hypothetical protein [Holosporales bacterium]
MMKKLSAIALLLTIAGTGISFGSDDAKGEAADKEPVVDGEEATDKKPAEDK